MESSENRDHNSLEPAPPASAPRQDCAVPDGITHRLRDREQLRKRRAEAEEKDSIQWVLSREQTKRQRRGRRTKQGRQGKGRQPVVEFNLEPEPELDPQPKPREDVEPVPSYSAALPEPEPQDQPPILTLQDVVSVIQAELEDGDLAASGEDPLGAEDMPSGAEIPEIWNTSLDSEPEDNEYNTHLLF